MSPRFGTRRPSRKSPSSKVPPPAPSARPGLAAANHSTKQIELFPKKQNVPVSKVYVYYGQDQSTRELPREQPWRSGFQARKSNTKVDGVYLQVKNREEATAWASLCPPAACRVYKKDDADGSLEFIGEDVIGHTAKNEEVLVRLGSAFDVVGDRKQTDFQLNAGNQEITESVEIHFASLKTQAKRAFVKEENSTAGRTGRSRSAAKFERHAARTIRIPVDVPADGEEDRYIHRQIFVEEDRVRRGAAGPAP